MQDPEGMGWPRPVHRRKKLEYREKVALQLLADGLTIDMVARRLEISSRTVARMIHERLGANTAAHAVAIGYQLGWLGGARLMLVPVA